MIRLTIQRITSGNSPFFGDKNHLHHLMKLLIEERFIFLTYILIGMAPIIIYSFIIQNFYIVFILSIAMYFAIYIFLINLKKT
jgi:hypothetical protein